MVRAMLCGLLVLSASQRAFADDWKSLFPNAIGVAQSKPLVVNEARFIATTQTSWAPAENRKFAEVYPRWTEILVQLQITNLAKGKAAFPTSDCFGVRLYKKDGGEVFPTVNRSYASPTSPIMLDPNGTYTICRRGEVRTVGKANECEFLFHCSTGQSLRFESLEPGDYLLKLSYCVNDDRKLLNVGANVSAWSGAALSNEVPFKIHSKPVGGGLHLERELPSGRRVRQIAESKPVDKGDARFVVACDAAWKFDDDPVPIDVQLRFSNLSNDDMVFRTFDSFDLMITDKDGKPVSRGGGRDWTRFTPPLLVPGGASVSLCHRTELRSDSKNGNRLFYWDGTGSVATFGPLTPGRYELKFVYGGPCDPKYPNEAHPRLWCGNAASESVVVEVTDRTDRK